LLQPALQVHVARQRLLGGLDLSEVDDELRPLVDHPGRWRDQRKQLVRRQVVFFDRQQALALWRPPASPLPRRE
jgi:hypothetical protein